MRIPTVLLAGGVALALVLGACNDDTDVDAGDEPPGDGTGGGDAAGGDPTVPTGPPDLAGTITTVTPFEPVTEDCTPPEDLDPDAAVSSDDPPICTAEDNDVVGAILVEEDPSDPAAGRKISYTVTTSTAFEAGASFDDLATGQTVDTWVAGDGCAESYPEQCGLAAIRVTG